MSRYLQRLISRTAGGPRTRPLVPFVHTPFAGDAAGAAAPFEGTAPPLPVPTAEPAPGANPPVAGPRAAEPAVKPAGAWPTTADRPLPAAASSADGSAAAAETPPWPRSAAPSALRVTASRVWPAEDPRPAVSPLAPLHRAAYDRPAPAAPTTPAAEVAPVVAPPPLAAAAVPAWEAPLPGPAHPAVRPPAPSTLALAALPAAEKPPAERRLPELRPTTPPPAAATARAAEPPRVVIGRVSVEVVPTPQTAPARPAGSRPTMPDRNDAPCSPLRFGLGQM